ncbi:DNA repair protein RecO [Leptolyngbya sp. NK1-12]|uniref:DNA repair protein RecO n=1 Tax=Leptolyngbya sp. NK1-12 TaxID=2547451 RepID=A0AA97AIC6_9CYAN|nr:DNA repair protein RecO [Leptolyngbya sp. NK1-12]WNZ21737.1 DNA repair protein RecO [Leptolyngbya sp. NK1-12]
MSGTYKAIGINLKSTPLGEADRLLTVLTDEWGLVRVVAPGSRKHKSSLGGRSSLFVVNQLLLAKGRTLDKIIQAESIESFPGLSQDLCKLTAAQYLAELTLYQALSDQPQTELLCLLREHLGRIETLPASTALASLIHATFHLLALAGLTPQLHSCCISKQPLALEPDLDWQVGFSAAAGGTILLDHLDRIRATPPSTTTPRVAAATGEYGTHEQVPKSPELLTHLSATDLALLQKLTQPNLIPDLLETEPNLLHSHYQQNWLTIERALRHYAQYHFDRPIRSAALIDVCFASADAPSSRVNHDAIV